MHCLTVDDDTFVKLVCLTPDSPVTDVVDVLIGIAQGLRDEDRLDPPVTLAGDDDHHDDNHVATAHVDHDDDCPGCLLAAHSERVCRGFGTAPYPTRGDQHTCGVY